MNPSTKTAEEDLQLLQFCNPPLAPSSATTNALPTSLSSHDDHQHPTALLSFVIASSDSEASSIASTDYLSVESSDPPSEDASSSHYARREPSYCSISARYTLALVFGIVGTIMNAAITIFGMGIGVGLILGDSFRDRSTTTTMATSSSRSEEVVLVSATSSPSCGRATGTTILRSTRRIQEPPTISLAAANLLPAQ
jgi:hypothetical protein